MLTDRFASMTVLGEPPPPAVEPPYMIAELATMSQTAMLGGYASRTHGFVIQFAAPAAGGVGALHDMAEELYGFLQLVEIEGARYRAANMKHEIREGKLRFEWEMTIRVKLEPPETPMMGVIEQGAGLK